MSDRHVVMMLNSMGHENVEPCKLILLPGSASDDCFEIRESSIRVKKSHSHMALCFMVDSVPGFDSVIVPFINHRHHECDGNTGWFLPSDPPVVAGFPFRYDKLDEDDVLRFVQCKALASGVVPGGPHRPRGYKGKVGPVVQTNPLSLHLTRVKQERNYHNPTQRECHTCHGD